MPRRPDRGLRITRPQPNLSVELGDNFRPRRWEVATLGSSPDKDNDLGSLATTEVSTPFGEFVCFENDRITGQLRTYGAHQRSDLAMLLSLIRRGDLVIDVGAHIGTFAIPIGRKVGPAGVVYAFEPVEAHFEVLRENVARNDLADVVVPVNSLVTCSHAQLRVDYWRDMTGMARFHEGGMIDLPTERTQLDEWWRSLSDRPQVAMIKVDVEGMELDVLQSGRDLIRSQRPLIIFEVDRHRGRRLLAGLDRFFRDLGYHMFVNLSQRNSGEDTFRLARLRRLKPFALVSCPLLDVVAVPPDSSRYPPASVPAAAMQAVMLSRVGTGRARYLAAARKRLRPPRS
jgi:FkbM family methyltransferase